MGWYNIYTLHFRGLLFFDRILPSAKFTLHLSLAFFYIISVTAQHSSSGIGQTLRSGTIQGTELRNFRTERHLYSAGWPSCWASAHILVLSFITYFQLLQTGCLPYCHTWCGLSANLGCRCETCYTRLVENTGGKKLPKIRHLRTIAQLCWAMSSQVRHVSTIRKKNLLNSNISSTCPHSMVNFGPLTSEICW